MLFWLILLILLTIQLLATLCFFLMTTFQFKTFFQMFSTNFASIPWDIQWRNHQAVNRRGRREVKILITFWIIPKIFPKTRVAIPLLKILEIFFAVCVFALQDFVLILFHRVSTILASLVFILTRWENMLIFM